MISYNLDDVLDIDDKLHSFYKSFYSMIRHFKYINVSTLLFIFNSFCLPSYGLSLWNSHNVFNKCIFRTFDIAYSNALKQICQKPKYSSSHEVAISCNMLLLKHLVALNQIRFLHKLNNFKKINSVFNLNYYFIKSGSFSSHVFNVFKNFYGVCPFNNDIQALCSRIFYLQRNENRSYNPYVQL